MHRASSQVNSLGLLSLSSAPEAIITCHKQELPAVRSVQLAVHKTLYNHFSQRVLQPHDGSAQPITVSSWARVLIR